MFFPWGDCVGGFGGGAGDEIAGLVSRNTAYLDPRDAVSRPGTRRVSPHAARGCLCYNTANDKGA